MSNSTKILWAVDPFAEDKELHGNCVKALKAWVKGNEEPIRPVYVMSPDQMRIPAEVFANLRHKAEESGQKKMEALLKSAKIASLEKPTFLASFNYSLQSAVHVLLDYAKSEKADLIAVSTQSRKGVTRFLFGSFAETLALQSEIPLLLVSPKMGPVKELKTVFYATDLSDKSQETFEEVLKLAEKHQMRLVLYNKIEYYTQYTSSTIGNSLVYSDYLKENIAERNKHIQEMAEQARGLGIKTEIIIDQNPKTLSTPTAILKAAKKVKASLIAIGAKTGPVQTALLGSVTRQVLRESHVPLWVLHSKRKIAVLPRETSERKPNAVVHKLSSKNG